MGIKKNIGGFMGDRESQTWNMYAYVRNNPETLTDPSGMTPVTEADAAGDETTTDEVPSGLGADTGPDTPDGENRPGGEKAQQQNSSTLNKDKFVNYMDQHAKNRSQHICAAACRRGLEAGGLNTNGHPVDAGDYGPFLLKHGASVVPGKNYKPQKGDTIVFDKNKAHPFGHIEVYNGKGWVSDFKQHSMIPYRSDVPPRTVYRFPDDQ